MAADGQLPWIVLGSSKDRDDWLKLRRSGIGASEIAAVLGESPWLSATALYAEKIGELEPSTDEDPEYMYWGQQLEASIVAGYQDRTGRPVQKASLLLRSVECPWAVCTLDALTGDVDGQPAWPLEIKNVGAHNVHHWENGCPRHYYLQCQQQMLVTGARKATIAALIGGQRMIWCDIDRDEIEIKRIKIMARIFWEQCVEKRICPRPDSSESASRALYALYRKRPHPDAHVKLSGEVLEMDDELQGIKQEQGALKKRRDQIENLIKAALGKAQWGVLPSGAVYSWKKQSNGVAVLRRHASRQEKRK